MGGENNPQHRWSLSVATHIKVCSRHLSKSVSETHSEPKLDHKQKHAGDFSPPSYMTYQQEEISAADTQML